MSAAASKRLRNRHRVPVMLQGSTEPVEGFLYLIDSVADPATRTYTVTLLLRNTKAAETEATIPEGAATIEKTWRLDLQFLPGREEGMLFVDETAIQEDQEGPFLWRITNVRIDDPIPVDRLFQVAKLRVRRGPAKVPFLGNWLFQQVMVDDDQFDASRDLVAGRLTSTSEERGGQAWNGDTLYLSSHRQWQLRPGDVVRVDLSSEDASPGYFVPMECLIHRDGRSYLMAIDAKGEANTVQELKVRVVEPSDDQASSSLRQVLPDDGADPEALEGVRYVTRGVHYLRNGEAVKIVNREETAQ